MRAEPVVDRKGSGRPGSARPDPDRRSGHGPTPGCDQAGRIPASRTAITRRMVSKYLDSLLSCTLESELRPPERIRSSLAGMFNSAHAGASRAWSAAPPSGSPAAARHGRPRRTSLLRCAPRPADARPACAGWIGPRTSAPPNRRGNRIFESKATAVPSPTRDTWASSSSLASVSALRGHAFPMRTGRPAIVMTRRAGGSSASPRSPLARYYG